MAVQLAPLPEIQRLSPLVIRILGGNPSKFTLQGTNTYLIGRGPRRILLDTGEGRPSWIAALSRALAAEGPATTVATALLSHWHPDHIGGVADLRRLCPGVEVYKNGAGAGAGADLEIAGGQEFAVEGATLRAHHTPGHAADHMVFVLREEDAMFTADNVLGQGTAVFEDLSAYLDSLGRMETLFAGRAYPGHGPVVEDGRAKIREYVAHRQQREDQITQTLRAVNEATGTAAWEPMELVRVIYRDVPEYLHLPAQGGVVQVLQKLQKEGKVSQQGARWAVADRPAL